MPAALRSNDLTILIAAGIATVLLSILSFMAAPVQTASPIDGSSFATHPAGARAAYLALKRAGYTVERSFDPITALRREPGATALIFANPAHLPSQQDRRALDAFVRAGGLLLAAGPGGAAFLPGQPFGRGTASPPAGTTAAASMVSPLSRGVPEIEMAPPGASLAPASPYVPVYGDAARPYVIVGWSPEFRAPSSEPRVPSPEPRQPLFGGGQAIWWSGLEPLTNDGLSRPGHAELILNALGDPSRRVVIWDEHYHGHTRSFWSYVAATPVPYAGAQLALVFVASILAFSRRRWPPRAQPVEQRTSPLEFVDSMGALYQRAGVNAGSVSTVRMRLRRLLVAASRLPSSASDADLSRAAASRVSMDAEELGQLLESSAQASRAIDLGPEQARSIVAALQAAAARLHSGETRS